MAKKQTRRSISVSRTTYERLKAFCETNGISMSQFVENRVGDFLGEGAANPESGGGTVDRAERTSAPRPASQPPLRSIPGGPTRTSTQPALAPVRPQPQPQPQPMITSAAARYAIDPPPPIIKKAETAPPKAPTMPKADQIFTF